MKLTIEGDQELFRLLDTLPKKLQKKSIRSGVTKAARDVLKVAKQLVPVAEGNLKASLKSRVVKTKRKTIHARRVIAAPEFFPDDYYAAFVEYGHDNVPANPYMRTSYERQKGPAIKTIENEIRAQIEQEADSTLKR